jgi:hypothetical protein
VAGPYDEVIGTDVTPTTVSITLPAREVAFIEQHMTAVGTATVDYLGEYVEPATDTTDFVTRIVRTQVGEWVKNTWERAHPESADDRPEGGMG